MVPSPNIRVVKVNNPRKMKDKTEKISVISITERGKEDTLDVVVRELPLTIFLNSKELVTTLCSPVDLEYLVAGILASEGLLGSRDEIKSLRIDTEAGVAYVETKESKEITSGRLFKPLVASGGGKGASSYKMPDIEEKGHVVSQATISASEVSALINDFLYRSSAYQATRGVHSAALCDNQGIMIFHDDIGRHNAIDKVFGQCLLDGIPLDDRIIITSGRISSEILLKVARRKIPILISKSAPTNLGVSLANNLGVTIIRFIRGKGMKVYSHGWRVVVDDG
jgi:FdhD protein